MNESDEPTAKADSWIIEGMLPIAVAHAEAAARAAGMTIGQWLSQLIAAQAPPVIVDPAPRGDGRDR